MPTIARFLTALALAALPFAAAAQAPAPDAPDAESSIALSVDKGSVRISTGAEFTPPTPGQRLAPGDRVMVADGGAATLIYPNGCRKLLVHTGVYLVDGLCDAGAGRAGGPGAGAIAGAAAGVGALAALAGGGGGGDDRPPPPVSR